MIGPERVLGVRLGGDEGVPDGTSLADAVETARLLDHDGVIDYVNTSVGVATATLHLVEPPMGVPAGYAQAVPSAIRAAVSLPVIGVGRFTDPAQAERAIRAGECDLVGVVRGQIADPDFAARARASRRIRSCTGCNQECAGRVGLNMQLGCVVNPSAGHEGVPLPAPVRPGRRVLVVGGGPAGLQAAATAAARGHRVVLCERRDRTGGQVADAASAPGREEFGAAVRDLLAECLRLRVDVRTGTTVDLPAVRREEPDVIVLATGARPALPEWSRALDRVVDVRDVLRGAAEPSGTVLVYDELGFHHGTSVAELLAARGCAVAVMTPGMVVGQDLGLTLDMPGFHRRARGAGIALSTDRAVLGAAAAGSGVRLTVLHHPVGAVSEVACDWVVCAVPPVPENELWTELRSHDVPVHRIGDCVAPRRAHAAVLEGYRVGAAL